MSALNAADAAVTALDSEHYREAREFASQCTFEEIKRALATTGRCALACNELASYLVHPTTDHRL